MPIDIPFTVDQLDFLLKFYGSNTSTETLDSLFKKMTHSKKGDALYVYDGTMIVSNGTNLISKFTKYFPDFIQYFAVKALPNPHILKLLHDISMGFDCSSITELKLVQEIETKYSIQCKKIFSSNYTTFQDIAYFFTEIYSKDKTAIINFDDECGLNFMIEFFDKLKIIDYCKYEELFPKLICFRLNPLTKITNSEVKSNVLSGSESKFGIIQEKIFSVYKLAKEFGVKEFGIHVMTGSCILDRMYFANLVDDIFLVVNDLDKKLNIKIKFINLGGGIGIPYLPDVEPINLDLLVENIHLKVLANIEKYSLTWSPNILMENGRYITGPYGWLITRCGSIKSNDKIFYGLEACMSNLMRPGMYGAYHHISIPILKDEKELEKVNVVGSLCENNDWFARSRLLPKGIRVGDIVVIHDCGAHSHSMCFQYNGKLRCGEVLYTGRDFKLIRRPEQYLDYVSTITQL